MGVIDILEARLRPLAAFLPPGTVDALVKEFRQMRVDIDNLQTEVGRLKAAREDGADGEG